MLITEKKLKKIIENIIKEEYRIEHDFAQTDLSLEDLEKKYEKIMRIIDLFLQKPLSQDDVDDIKDDLERFGKEEVEIAKKEYREAEQKYRRALVGLIGDVEEEDYINELYK